MTIVSSIKASDFEKRYAFAQDESPIVVIINVPIDWDGASPEWVKDRCKL